LKDIIDFYSQLVIILFFYHIIFIELFAFWTLSGVDKKELLVYLTRLAKKGIIERKWHKSRAGKERMYCLKYKEEMI
jgi:hypothetical protein